MPDYTPGCRRILIANDWYPTLLRPERRGRAPTPSRRSPTHAIRTADGRSSRSTRSSSAPASTAPSSSPRCASPVATALDLNQVWADGAGAYLGVAVPGFPNLFMLYGPNTNLGHNSILFMIEQQVGYIRPLIVDMVDEGAVAAEVTRPRWTASTRDRHRGDRRTVWAEDCHSWYKTEAGRVTNNWPDYSVRYRSAPDAHGANGRRQPGPSSSSDSMKRSTAPRCGPVASAGAGRASGAVARLGEPGSHTVTTPAVGGGADQPPDALARAACPRRAPTPRRTRGRRRRARSGPRRSDRWGPGRGSCRATTAEHVVPGLDIPVQKLAVANRHCAPRSRNCSCSTGLGASPWHRIVKSGTPRATLHGARQHPVGREQRSVRRAAPITCSSTSATCSGQCRVVRPD